MAEGDPSFLDSLYPYTPSTPAAILFTVLYFLVALAHTYMQALYPRRLRRRSNSSQPCRPQHRYTIPTAIAAGLSTGGYALRIASVKMPKDISLYATSSSLIVISPIFVCASLYLLLARLIGRCLPTSTTTTTTTAATKAKEKSSNPQRFFGVSPRWIGRLFITSDILSFLTQGGGTSIAAGGEWKGDSARIGTNVLLLGLSLQLATFTAFMLLLWIFVCRVRVVVGVGFEVGVKRLLVGVAVASVFIEVRSVFRVVEFALGIDGYPFANEWCLYVLEAVPMWVALAALAWWHPVRLLPEGMQGRKGEKSEELEERGLGAEEFGRGKGGEQVRTEMDA